MKKLFVILMLAGVSLGGWSAYRTWNGNGSDGVQYEPVELQRGRIEVTVESTGVVEPRNRLEIKPPIAGRIDDVLVSEGQAVKKGDVMAWMSSIERATLLDAARAKGKEVLRKWEDAYKPTPLIAPLDGTIIARNTEPGQTVTAQDAILVLSDRLIVSAQVDETDIGQVRVDQAATITLDAYPDVKVSGTVRHIAYEALTVNNVTIYEVEVEPESIPACMKSGMTAAVAFRVAEADDVLVLPTDAVVTQDADSFVLVDDGRPKTPPQRRRVRTGLRNGGRVEILAGLDGDETVVKEAFRLPKRNDTSGTPFMPSRRKP